MQIIFIQAFVAGGVRTLNLLLPGTRASVLPSTLPIYGFVMRVNDEREANFCYHID